MYRKSHWNVDAVPDADMSLTSYIFSVRLAATKLRLDPSTSKPHLEDTPLIKRALTHWSEEQLLAMCSNGKRIFSQLPTHPTQLPENGPQGATA